ncbi:MAG: hypothetical protein ACK4FB_08075 [Brevundimonas sp.]|uniref:hypothetical protein n=1 Tax=Brevundimonas sp. TaxID=1871086 RepID=UPI00391B394D
MTFMLLLAALSACLFTVFFRPFTHLPFPYTADEQTMARCAAFDAWDDAMRGRNVFAGLHLFRRTSCARTVNLACRHWPHLLCWQWILALDVRPHRPMLWHFHRSGPGAMGGESWTLRFLWLFCLRYQRQASDRITQPGPLRSEAPEVYPRDHHLKLVA